MRQTLLIDADDTLWENNIYFEQAIHQFLTFLNHSVLTPPEIRAILDEIEHGMGYGSANFTQSLLATYDRVSERAVTPEDQAYIKSFGAAIRQHPIELMSGVEETLAYLQARHSLILLTEGDEEEQILKVDNSGLSPYFEQLYVVAEKEEATYRKLIADLQIDPAQTWMIGNSPRSDINPALAAQINAVFIPHPHTWQLEVQELQPTGPGQFLQLAQFADLRHHF